MQSISIKEILEVTQGTLLCGDSNQDILHVSTSSRNIKEKSLFIPIKGEKLDGHDFIRDAFENGAIATLTEKPDFDIKYGVFIKVNDTRESLQKLAAYYRRRFKNIDIIGITGSVGKTTTKEMVASALSLGLDVMKTEGNYNSQIGLPLTMFKISDNNDVGIIEMGMSEFGEMARLASIALPNKAVITNIGISHIENLKTQENILSEKLHIIDSFDENGVLFLNGDDEHLKTLKGKVNAKVVYFGTQENCDYIAKDIDSNGDSTTFKLVYPDGADTIRIPTLGIHNVYNALAAIAVAISENLSIEQIKSGLLTYSGIAMRQQIHKINGITIIDDSYNASPDSMKSAINVLTEMKSEGRNIAVLADMLELGEKSEEEHFKLGQYVAYNNVDVVIAVGNQAKSLVDGVMSVPNNLIAKSFDSNEDAIQYLLPVLSKNDKVLVKGSRGMHTEEIVNSVINYIK